MILLDFGLIILALIGGHIFFKKARTAGEQGQGFWKTLLKPIPLVAVIVDSVCLAVAFHSQVNGIFGGTMPVVPFLIYKSVFLFLFFGFWARLIYNRARSKRARTE